MPQSAFSLLMDESLAPIFIVGMPRSGTTLLETFLASHRDVSCGAETHFFPYSEANRQQLASILQDCNWPGEATGFMEGLAVEKHSVHQLFDIRVQDIFDFLAKRRPSLQALLESLTVQHMLATQKTRWAEKTPNHTLHLGTIRQLYPHAKAVRIVRDPRDSALSMAAKLPWASDSAVDNAYFIRRWYRKSKHFFQQDNLTYTLKYETLVTHSQNTLRTLCNFIQVPYDPDMMETQSAAQHTAPDHETWKSQVGQKLDPSRCFAWRKHQPDAQLNAVSLVCQDMIKEFDYP